MIDKLIYKFMVIILKDFKIIHTLDKPSFIWEKILELQKVRNVYLEKEIRRL